MRDYAVRMPPIPLPKPKVGIMINGQMVMQSDDGLYRVSAATFPAQEAKREHSRPWQTMSRNERKAARREKDGA